jgi:stalled ribosome rescue protein Dom34
MRRLRLSDRRRELRGKILPVLKKIRKGASMADYVVWLDSEKASIFALKPEGIESSHVKHSGEKANRDNKDADAGQVHFFKDIASQLKDAQSTLLVGPGLAKAHFKSYAEDHYAGTVGKSIIGSETSDHPSDKQVLAIAQPFFKTYEKFDQPVKAAAI